MSDTGKQPAQSTDDKGGPSTGAPVTETVPETVPETAPESTSQSAPQTAPETTTQNEPETSTTGNPPAVAQTDPGTENTTDDEADSALGEEDQESTQSLRSSIYDYRTIRGRMYHRETGNASYWGTIDEGHSESLDILHHLFTLLLDKKLYKAPIKDPKNVLDVGTGTGIWAIDFADEHPECEVIGTDISPIQPTWLPPNLKFEIEDCTQEWTFQENRFDFIHIRYLGGSIADWTAFFKEAYKCTAPGGWLESHEGSPIVYSNKGELPDTAPSSRWGPLFIEGGKKIGRSFEIVDDGTQNKAMEAAGFVDIQEHWIKVPAGGWSDDPKQKEIGNFAEYAIMSDVESFILFFTAVLGWSREEVAVYIAHLRRELKQQKYQVYYWQKIVVGRKPDVAH